MLAAAPMIHLVGYRRAFPVASYLAYALEKMAVPCILHSGGRQARHRATRCARATRWSRSPSRPTAPRPSPSPRRADGDGHPVVAVTDSLSSPLQRLDAIPLLVSEVDVGAFRALSATFALAMRWRLRPARDGRKLTADAAILGFPNTE